MTDFEGIFRWVVDTTAASVVLLTLAYGLMLVLKQPARRLRVAELALVGCLGLAILQALPMTRFSLGIVQTGQPVMLPWFDDGGTSARAPVSASHSGQARAPALHASLLPAGVRSAAVYGFRHWRELVLGAYTLGVLLAMARLVLSWRTLRQLRRRSAPPASDVQKIWNSLATTVSPRAILRVSREVERPITFGLRRPVVLVPACVADTADANKVATLQAILRHELGHIERRDAVAWLLAAAVNVLLFFLPPLWLVKRQMRLAQEFLADQVAAQSAGGRVAYAEIMLRLVQVTQGETRPALAMAAWRTRPELLVRIRHLFDVRFPLERRCRWRWTLAIAACVLTATAALGAMTLADTSLTGQVRRAELRGVAYLLVNQELGGGWLTQVGPAPSALIVRSLLQAGVPADHPAILRARDYVAHCRQADGGYYTDGEPAYQTAVVLSMYAAFKDSDAIHRLADGRRFLEQEQATHHPVADGWYSPAQGDNEDGIAALQTKPGAVFADPGERAADAVAYGDLTYGRWKSLVYAGLKDTVPRVQLSVQWLERHWTLDNHPGTGSAEGLFYYYVAAARTLQAAGVNQIGASPAHDWRAELDHKLLAGQASDGSWVNGRSGRWLEDRPEMVTAYALLALQEARRQ